MNALLDAVAAVATPVRLAFLWRPMVRDPDDDMVLEAAVNGNAEAIVTFNRRDFAKVAGMFRDRSYFTRRGVAATGGKNMRKSNFALRLQPSLLDEARKVAEAEGVALNQLINVAVAEKLSALRTESCFQERGARADIAKALDILKRAGTGNQPIEGDELRRRMSPRTKELRTAG
jgi:predicted HicB family RNase H-like nuclease